MQIETNKYIEHGRGQIEAARAAFLRGESPFQNFGLGAMTAQQRAKLIAEGKIVVRNGMDAVALKRIGVIEYEMYKTKEIRRVTVYGSEAQIQMKLDAADTQIKNARGSVFYREIEFVPAWDGQF